MDCEHEAVVFNRRLYSGLGTVALSPVGGRAFYARVSAGRLPGSAIPCPTSIASYCASVPAYVVCDWSLYTEPGFSCTRTWLGSCGGWDVAHWVNNPMVDFYYDQTSGQLVAVVSTLVDGDSPYVNIPECVAGPGSFSVPSYCSSPHSGLLAPGDDAGGALRE